MPEGARSVIIDPDKTLPDINRPNNATSKPLTFTWVFDQPQYYKTEVYWLPWLFNGNQYNGLTPGLNFYYGFVPGYDYGLGIKPMWDFQNEKIVGTFNASKTYYDIGNFYTSTFNVNLARYAGRTGGHIEFKGKQKEHLKRYPVWETIFNVDYNNILETAVDSDYYDSGNVISGYAELEHYNRPNPFLSYYFRTALKTGIVNSQFLRFNMQSNLYYKFSKKIKSKLRLWIGGFLDSTNIPRQYRTYLSGNIDPDFQDDYLINRTANVNDVSIGTRQYDIGGPSIHGLVLDGNKKMLGVSNWVLSANFESNVPKLSWKPFGDIAYIISEEIYFDIGLKKSFGPISIIVPFYQSWDENSFPKDTNWILDRLRFSINVSNLNYRSFF